MPLNISQGSLVWLNDKDKSIVKKYIQSIDKFLARKLKNVDTIKCHLIILIYNFIKLMKQLPFRHITIQLFVTLETYHQKVKYVEFILVTLENAHLKILMDTIVLNRVFF